MGSERFDRFAFVPSLREHAKRGVDLDVRSARATSRPSSQAAARARTRLRVAAEGPAHVPSRRRRTAHGVRGAPRRRRDVRARRTARSVHLTVSPQHLTASASLLARVQPEHERRLAARFTIGFSHQEPSTDTVAVDLDGNRSATPTATFSSVPPDTARCSTTSVAAAPISPTSRTSTTSCRPPEGPVVHWKKVLGGLLATLQEKVFGTSPPRRDARRPPSTRRWHCCATSSASFLPTAHRTTWPRALPSCAVSSTARCACVRHGPRARAIPAVVRSGAWPQRRGESQVVETAQIDASDAGQQVDARGLDLLQPGRPRVRSSRPPRARRSTPRSTSTPRRCSSARSRAAGGSCARRAPGLWNGSMADWEHGFVAVPTATFNPVRDDSRPALKPQHQPPPPEHASWRAISGRVGPSRHGQQHDRDRRRRLHRGELRPPRAGAHESPRDRARQADLRRQPESLPTSSEIRASFRAHGDICDGALVSKLLAEHRPTWLVNFAARSRTSTARSTVRARSCRPTPSARSSCSTRRPLGRGAARRRAAQRSASCTLDRRGVRHARAHRNVLETTPYAPNFAVRGLEGGRGPPGARVPRGPTDCRP